MCAIVLFISSRPTRICDVSYDNFDFYDLCLIFSQIKAPLATEISFAKTEAI